MRFLFSVGAVVAVLVSACNVPSGGAGGLNGSSGTSSESVSVVLDPEVSPSPSDSASPSPTPLQSASPSPSPSASPWVGTPGNLVDGSWHDPVTAPDAGHAGAYSGITYAPNGDLYLFYETGVYPNEIQKNVIRRSGGNAWTSEFIVGTRNRTANVYFDGNGVPKLAAESGGSVTLYTAANYLTNNVSWNMDAYFQANDGNIDGFGVYGDAFLTKNGNNLNLFYTYLYYNAVVGSENWGIHEMQQSNGAWPGNGSYGTIIDVDHPNYYVNPHGVSGAFEDAKDNVLAFSSAAFKSTDGGQTFGQIMNSDVAANNLTGVSGASQNPTDDSIIVGNYYSIGENSGDLALWGTRDMGSSFTKMLTQSVGGTFYRAKIATIMNLVVLVYTRDGGNGESELYATTSNDGGVNWTNPVLLVDATNSGQHPTYTFGSVNLTANSLTGSIALAYTLVDGAVHHGVYLKEFY